MMKATNENDDPVPVKEGAHVVPDITETKNDEVDIEQEADSPEAAAALSEASTTTHTRNKRHAVFAGILLISLASLALIIGSVVGTRDQWHNDSEDSGDRDDDNLSSPRMTISGQIVDIHNRKIFPGFVVIGSNNQIVEVRSDPSAVSEEDKPNYILPGFVDAHVHIESSLLVPSEFARLAVRHGTVATVSDPHEIANVLGRAGIQFMLDNAEQVPFYFFFGAPCCVPATPFETAGAELNVTDIEELFQDDRIKYLSEMMNWPGVLYDDPIVLAKIKVAKDNGRPVDGHAPGLTGEDAKTYIEHGITTDHECYLFEEATDKLSFGMKIQIRQGSAARNYDVLHPIIDTNPDNVMFCTDDAHPDYLLEQDVDYHVRKSMELGYDIFDVLRIASKNPIEHYSLPVGMLRVGDSADFIVVDSLQHDFNVLETWIKGAKVADQGEALFESVPVELMNNFKATPISVADIARNHSAMPVRVIQVHDGDLITTSEVHNLTEPDVLKLVVVNRYQKNASRHPAVAYTQGFGLHTGAIASSVAHDSHNIVAVGVTDEDIVDAINAVIAVEGGLVVVGNGTTQVLNLPVAGIMSNRDAFFVAEQYSFLDARAKEYGSPFRAPFMTLSFMALLVIPELKLSDMGLFDGMNFEFVDVEV